MSSGAKCDSRDVTPSSLDIVIASARTDSSPTASFSFRIVDYQQSAHLGSMTGVRSFSFARLDVLCERPTRFSPFPP
jgi:hypothetical protein